MPINTFDCIIIIHTNDIYLVITYTGVYQPGTMAN